jgi:hypothetical protein
MLLGVDEAMPVHQSEICVVTQRTTAYCNEKVINIELMKYCFINISFLRVVQQKYYGSNNLLFLITSQNSIKDPRSFLV